MKLDLHGHKIHDAWNLFNSRVTEAYYNKHTSMVIITGQGAIMREFQGWCAQHHHIKSCTNAPHNPGSYKITLKKG